LNIVIQDSAVNLRILAPSGLMVSVGGNIQTTTSLISEGFSAGVEKTIVSVSGRGRLRGIGWSISALNTTTDIKYTEIRIYVDGSLVFDLDLSTIDMLFNGYQVYLQGAATSTIYYAKTVNPKGAVSLAQTTSDSSGEWQLCNGFLNIETEYSSSLVVKVYNASVGGYVSMVVMYGPYV
jgi:hypothetical protein